MAAAPSPDHPRLNPFAALAATALSAGLYGLCFPSSGLSLAAWVAQVPFFVALRRSSTPATLFLGWLFAVTVAGVSGDWFPAAVAAYYEQPLGLGIAVFFAVSSIMAAPYVMAFAVAYRRLSRRFGAALPLLTAAAWVAGELARTTVLSGCPWAVFGYSQAGAPALVQIADVTGVYGVSFVLVACNAALAELWLQRSLLNARVIGGLAAATSVTAAVFCYGLIRIGTGSANLQRPTAIAIAQGNLDVGSQWRSEYYGRNLDVYVQLSQQALAATHPALLFWPESAMSFFLDQEQLYRDAIAYTLRGDGVQLIAGGPRSVQNAAAPGEEQYYNTTFLIAPEGDILERYDKQALLPFAEYFPFRSFAFLRRSFGRVREFVPGAPSPPLATIAGRAGVIVCNEAMFPGPAAARVADGAEYLVNPSNDSWLGDRKFSEEVFDMVRLRAVEQRRFLVRASTSGPSAIIDPLGGVVRRTEPFTRAWIDGAIEPRNQRTPYSRYGDVFAACGLLAAIAALIAR